MNSFQGTGFQLSLPEDAIDASYYVFLRNDGSPTPAQLRITAISVPEVPEDVEEFANAQLKRERKAMPDLDVVELTANERDNWIYATATVDLGESPTDLREQRIYLFVSEAQARLFTITVSAPKPTFDEANAYFAETIRSFVPNDVQNLLPELRQEASDEDEPE